MIKTVVGVEGMMCPRCEARVTKAIKEAIGAEDVTSSHEENRTVILSETEVSRDKIEEIITGTGYKVTSFASENV